MSRRPPPRPIRRLVNAERLGRVELRIEAGEHAYIVQAVYYVKPEVGMQVMLDTENVLDIAPPTCALCDQEWSPEADPVCAVSLGLDEADP